MNCPECHDLLQQRLDGRPAADRAALERHLSDCPDCRERHAAARLLERGLRALKRPTPPADLGRHIASRVLAERRQSLRFRRLLPLAAAAALLLITLGGYLWLRSWTPLPGPDRSPVAQEKKPPEAPSLRRHVEEAGSAAVALAGRVADETVGPTRRLLTEVPALPMPMGQLPDVTDLEQPLDPAAQSLRQAGQTVSAGLGPVATSARRAFDLFLREIPPLESDRKQGI
jgi:hypothetical protein